MRARAAWVALALVVVVTFAIAVGGGADEGGSAAARAQTVGEGVRCPTCRGQSVVNSAAPAAAAIRTEIRRRVDAGESRSEIESYLVERYGGDILLTPPSRGIGGVVWVLPVALLGAGAAGLALVLRRWSKRSLAVPTEADRAVVEEAVSSAASR